MLLRYVFRSMKQGRATSSPVNTTRRATFSDAREDVDAAIEALTDPSSGSPSIGKHARGVICLRVDALFCAGDPEFTPKSVPRFGGASRLGHRTHMASSCAANESAGPRTRAETISAWAKSVH